jgi:hypothetical protein
MNGMETSITGHSLGRAITSLSGPPSNGIQGYAGGASGCGGSGEGSRGFVMRRRVVHWVASDPGVNCQVNALAGDKRVKDLLLEAGKCRL